MDFELQSVKIVSCGLRALKYLGPKIWNIVSLAQFKMKIKSSRCKFHHFKMKPTHYPCNICPQFRIYIQLILDVFINFHQFIFSSRFK